MLELTRQQGTVKINLDRVTRVENPVNMSGIGGMAVGANPVRIFFADGETINVKVDAYDKIFATGDFVQIATDLMLVLVNPDYINYFDQQDGQWSVWMPHAVRIAIGHPQIFDEVKSSDDEDQGQEERQSTVSDQRRGDDNTVRSGDGEAVRT